MNLYIDIDGVLLTRAKKAPSFGPQFITFITNHFNCFWLTTHCRGGENKSIQYLSLYYEPDALKSLQKVASTDWMDRKTEAINYNEPFVWLDDYPFESEINDLKNYDKVDSLIKVDLNHPNELQNITSKLKAYLRLNH